MDSDIRVVRSNLFIHVTFHQSRGIFHHHDHANIPKSSEELMQLTHVLCLIVRIEKCKKFKHASQVKVLLHCWLNNVVH